MKTLIVLVGFFLLLLSSCDHDESTKSINSIPYLLDEWEGIQGKVLAESKPDFIGKKKAPANAPNVLIIMLDDAGYSSGYY